MRRQNKFYICHSYHKYISWEGRGKSLYLPRVCRWRSGVCLLNLLMHVEVDTRGQFCRCSSVEKSELTGPKPHTFFAGQHGRHLFRQRTRHVSRCRWIAVWERNSRETLLIPRDRQLHSYATHQWIKCRESGLLFTADSWGVTANVDGYSGLAWLYYKWHSEIQRTACEHYIRCKWTKLGPSSTDAAISTRWYTQKGEIYVVHTLS